MSALADIEARLQQCMVDCGHAAEQQAQVLGRLQALQQRPGSNSTRSATGLLVAAAAAGDAELLSLLLSATSTQPDQLLLQPNAKGRTALMAAAANGHVDAVSALLQHSPQQQVLYQAGRGVQPAQGPSALLLAVQGGQVGVVRLLLLHCPAEQLRLCNGDKRNRRSALTLAAECGHAEVVRLLLQHMPLAQLQQALGDGLETRGALLLAAKRGHTKTVGALLQHLQSCGLDLLRQHLLQCGQQDGSALIAAAEHGNAAVVELLLHYFPDEQVLVVDRNGYTALMLAARKGHVVVVDLLLRHKPEVQVLLTNKDQRNALMHAANAAANAVAVVQRLLAFEPKLQVLHQSPEGYSALFIALEGGNTEVVRQLLAHEPLQQLTRRRFRGTPLVVAVMRGHAATVDLLLQHIPEPGVTLLREHQVWEQGELLLMVALRRRHLEVAQTLLRYAPEQVQATDPDGSTALMAAAEGNSEAAVQLLLDLSPPGAVLAANKHGFTPLMFAAQKGSKDVINLLLQPQRSPQQQLEQRNAKGYTTLDVAAASAQPVALEALLPYVTDITLLTEALSSSNIVWPCLARRSRCWSLLFAYGADLAALTPQQRQLVYASLRAVIWRERHRTRPITQLQSLRAVCRAMQSLGTLTSPGARLLMQRSTTQCLQDFVAGSDPYTLEPAAEREAVLGMLRAVLRLMLAPDALTQAVNEAVLQLAQVVRCC